MLRRKQIQAASFLEVLRAAAALPQQIGEDCLAFRLAGLRQPADPGDRSLGIRWNLDSVRKQQIEGLLGGGAIPMRSRAQPVFRTMRTGGRFEAIQVDEAELKLSLGLPLLGGALIPGDRIRQALENPLATGVHEPETVLRFCVTQLACPSPGLQGFVELVLFMKGKAALPQRGCLAAALWPRLDRRTGGWGTHGSRIASL